MMASIEPSVVLEVLKILTTSSSQPKSPSSDLGPSSRFDQLLLNNIDTVENKFVSDPNFSTLAEWWLKDTEIIISAEYSPRWRFVCYCLKALSLLHLTLKKSLEDYNKTDHETAKPAAGPKISPDTLGFVEQKVTKATLQFVVCLGVCPYLQKGVGLPMQLRSGFSDLVQASGLEQELTESEKRLRLFQCLKVFLCCVFTPSLGTLVLTQHLADILAVLFQLTLSGNKKMIVLAEANRSINKTLNSLSRSDKIADAGQMTPASMVDFVKSKFNKENEDLNESSNRTNDCKDTEASINVETTDMTNDVDEDSAIKGVVESGDVSQVDIEYCVEKLEDLLAKIYPPLLVKTLLLLQGASPSKKPCVRKSILPPAPDWLRQECGRRLSEIVMRPKGVQSVLRGMLDGPGAGQEMSGAADWRKCDAVAKVIACCPHNTVSVEQYYKKVGPQIVEILHISDKQIGREFVRVACSTLSSMYIQYPDMARTYVIHTLLQPLLQCLHGTDIPTMGDVVVDEQKLTVCIEDCHKVFVCGVGDSSAMMCELQPVILTLYDLFVFTKAGVSALRTTCQEILLAFLKQMDSSVTLTCLKLMAFKQTTCKHEAFLPRMHQNLCFTHGSSGGVVVVKMDQSTSDNIDQEQAQDVNVGCIVSLLKELEHSGVTGEFLVHMLQELTSFIQNETEGSTDNLHSQASFDDDQLMMNIEKQNQSRVDQFYRKLMLLNVLGTVCEEIGPSCIKNAKHSLEFVKATLERGVQVCKATDDVMVGMFESETLTMAIGLLTAVLTGAFTLTPEDRVFMEGLLPLLQEISQHHPEASVQEMATDIRIAIATHGAIWSQTGDKKMAARNIQEELKKASDQKQAKSVNKPQKDRPKIEVIGDYTDTAPTEPVVEVKSNKSGLEQSKTIPKFDENTTIIKKINVDIEKESDLPSGNKINTAHTHEKIGDKDDLSGGNATEADNKLNQTGKHQSKSGQTCGGNSSKAEQEYFRKRDLKTADKDNQIVNDKDTSELEMAFKELCDPLIPVRGHGLIRLTKLVQSRDPEAFRRKEAIFTIFEENLDHVDSYMYLSAVNGLSAMSEVFPEFVVPKVCEQFSNFDTPNHGDTGKKIRSSELRMKLGEVLVKASRNLGDTIPAYRDMLLHSVLVGARDEDPHVRASSLSNLGDICKLLHFSIGSVIHEVFTCCSGLLRHDGDVQVRKAAAQALTLLLQGMGTDVFKILDSALKDIYRLLKQSIQIEKDEGVKLHVHLALTELDDIMRGQLFPNQKLEKKIRVRDYD